MKFIWVFVLVMALSSGSIVVRDNFDNIKVTSDIRQNEEPPEEKMANQIAAQNGMPTTPTNLKPEEVVCNFIAALRDANFSKIQTLTLQDEAIRLYSPKNAANLNRETIGYENPFLFQLSSIAGFGKLSESCASLVYGILANDEIYKNRTLDKINMEQTVALLDVNRLKNIELIQIFTLKDEYLPVNYLNTIANFEYIVAVCKLDDDYFAIGIEIAYREGSGFKLFNVWNVNDPDRKGTYSSYYSYYKTKNPKYFDYLKDGEYSIEKEVLDKMIPQKTATKADYFKDIFNINNTVYLTPEDAITAYIDGIKKNDINAILGISAASDICKHYNFKSYIESLRVFLPSVYNALPKSDFYDKLLENYYLSAFTQQTLISLLLIATDEATRQGFAEKGLSLSDIQQYNAINPKELSDLEIVDIFIPSAKTLGSDGIKALFKSQTKRFNANDKMEMLAIVKNKEFYSLIPFTLYDFGNGWKISEISSVFARLNYPLTRVKDVSEFNVFK